jgi:hypothetical protein
MWFKYIFDFLKKIRRMIKVGTKFKYIFDFL